jgi:glycosyltransferase involved in cell wall biosynthesis
VRLGVYTDYHYWREGDSYYAERAFFTFITSLRPLMDRIVLFGRVNPRPGRSHYRVPDDIDFVELPHYPSLAHPLAVLRGMAGSLRRFWRSLDDVDAVWLLGPHLLAIGFAVLAALRGKKVFLGVRQDLPRYVESRHPGKRWMTWAASVLEGTFRLMARRFPVVVVGPQLAANYSGAGRLLAVSVSLVGEDQIVDPAEAAAKPWENGELRILTVGRLETEKNPLLLADVLARLHGRDPRFRLLIVGEGPMAGDVEERLRELGVADHADMLGYVPIDGGLLDLYRSSHAFLHVSWTEGLPQTLFEAFASGLPVVATAVGGVPAAVGDAALLVEPGDPDPPAAELLRMAGDEGLRRRLIESGVERVRGNTLEAESRRVAEFFAAS